MISTYETIEIDIQKETAYISLNRPKSLNALNSTLIRELLDGLKSISINPNVKIVVLKGNGSAFSSGGDIKEMLQMSGEDLFKSFMDHINDLVTTLYGMPKITIAAISGAAAGLGLSIALACDHIVAEKDSKIAMNFIGIGLVPDGGGHFLLERRIGQEKAKKLIWEGKVLSGEEAINLEIIDSVTDDIHSELGVLLKVWKAKPLLAMIKTKKIYTELNRPKFLKSLELEKAAQWKMRQTKDHSEGIQAFVEKRKPEFHGE
ncbi:enoyl-CoA hydratase [Heyndrickxia acidicola]|uniref:Enoyl-CoA hydratase n=1 Tax=Heyndrickxia acidicola TaxID=209389 RepID=A0ABU6MDA6_9BACI|nr:enoyl-CoA hydratase [Heyndrickxia acidicola]MED1202419.1 enoyl-CoA hydratase [Heyndrickxia acidicola]